MPTPPALYVLPLAEADYPTLADHCRALDWPAPTLWHHTDLHATVRELLARPSAPPAGEPVANRALTGLPAPVILCANLDGHAVRSLQRRYRDAGQRPILAVVTPRALTFSLAILLEHLAHDRRQELAAQPHPPAGRA